MSAYAASDLLALQASVKGDPEGYHDEFLLQSRHFQSLIDIFKLKPSKDSKEFGELAMFMAQVVGCYPTQTASFASQVMELLDAHYATLEPSLRRTLVQALVLMRNRHQIEPMAVLPLFFRLFRCQDKQLRTLLFRHIVSDIKNANRHARNEKLNRALQSFMYGVIQDDNESAAKKSLAVCTELWRRHVWRDARTVNVLATATFHRSSRIMLAVLKFFLGQEAADDGGSDVEDEAAARHDRDEEAKAKAPSKQDIYNSLNKGTHSSKKKKQRKIARVMATVKKAERKGAASQSESFAALHLLHDPQSFAERLFARLQAGNERFETRLAMIQVLSRVIGVHKLLVLNFYAFLQKYIASHQRDVTVVLAALVMACHEVVPPDTLQPVLRQLVDAFVHDRARPEVMTIGLKTVRELCMRAPLVMNEDLLQDLALYRKYRDKEVSSAAKGLIGLFREINPAMLSKKDRGRGADLDAKPRSYGEVDLKERVDGAELLEAALAAGQDSDDDDFQLHSEDANTDDESDRASDDSEAGAGGGAGSVASDAEDEGASSDSDGEAELGSVSDSDEAEESGSGDEDGGEGEEKEGGEEEASGSGRGVKPTHKLDKQEGSLASLRKALAEAKAKEGSEAGPRSAAENLEATDFLTEEDFARIKRLRQKQLVETAMAKHGLKRLTKAKQRRILEAAEEEAAELAEMREARSKVGRRGVGRQARSSSGLPARLCLG
uniref:Protein SDA1 n=2 Tax=Chlamydomonas euryale TaxID=1486919 RepID=A0A7R9V1A5_9CHLO|mmetsp:Transcript_14045/g.40774  ORF Transcript_14045/g.40774 Transcript_14045/m.40774 type:complete len:722 (+) Transcript_14045:225-2390(+)